MNRAERITATWKHRRHVDISSYTLGKQGVLLQEAFHGAFRRCMLARLKRKTGLRRFRRVIDLGCGTGEWSIAYLEIGDRVLGIDVNADFLDLASRRSRASDRADKIEFRRMNMLEFRDFRPCDLLCFGATLQYIADGELDRLFTDAIPQMEKDGVVYVRTTVAPPLGRLDESPVGYYRRAKWYEGLFSRHGLSVLDSGFTSVITIFELLRELRPSSREGAAMRVLEGMLGGGAWGVHTTRTNGQVMNWILTRGS